jgi:signal transduction histidine kinase
VPQGRYVFRVRAANHDGVWSAREIAMPVVVSPPFWRTPWFAALVALALIALLTAAYRRRVARLLAVERLRLRIASDLHDDLSTDLSAIALSSDLLRRRPDLDPESRERLGEMRERATRMVDAVRDTVWAVNPQHDTWESLVRRMRTTAQALLGESLARFKIDAPAGEALTMADRRNLFLLFKEMVHNAARHARAQRVEVALRPLGHGGFELEVVDDGVGFDPTAARGGLGLDSLGLRARQLGGELMVESAPARGTRLRFRRTSRKSGMA